MYLIRELTTLSLDDIGQLFGGRDHTTVMHGCDKITASMNADFSFKKRVEDIIGMIEGR